MEGVSKQRLEEILNALLSTDFIREHNLILSLLNECIELDPIPEYKDLPQCVFAQEGTLINISDGDNRGKWVSTKEGWIRYYPQCRQPNNLTPAQKHQAPI